MKTQVRILNDLKKELKHYQDLLKNMKKLHKDIVTDQIPVATDKRIKQEESNSAYALIPLLMDCVTELESQIDDIEGGI